MKRNSPVHVIPFFAVFCILILQSAVSNGMHLKLNADKDSLRQKEVKKFHYKISLPPGWSEHAESERGNKSFVASSEAESDEDSFIENMYVLNYKNIDEKLNRYYKEYFNRIRFSSPGFKKKAEGEEEINGEKVKYFVYTFDYKGIPLEVMVYVFLNNKTSYIFNAVALEGTYDKYKAAFQTMARSVEIQ